MPEKLHSASASKPPGTPSTRIPLTSSSVASPSISPRVTSSPFSLSIITLSIQFINSLSLLTIFINLNDNFRYGEVVDVNLVRDKGTGKSKGFAFLAYEDQRSTNLAVGGSLFSDFIMFFFFFFL